MQLHTAGLVVIKDKKLLLAFSRNKQAFYLPGGKTNDGETAIEGLSREISEELNINLHPDELVWYTHITAPAYGEANGIIMEQECYMCSLKHEPQSSAEIEMLEYFDSITYAHQPAQVPGVVMLLSQLKKDNLVN